MFEVKIRTGGAAFKSGTDDAYMDKIEAVAEIKFLLKKIIMKLEHGETEASIIDTNGNKVGEWRLD